MIEKFSRKPEDNPGNIVVPGVFPEPTGRHEDEHKPSIFDIEGALKIIENEENGFDADDSEHEPTLH